jgi:hypothetical protein
MAYESKLDQIQRLSAVRRISLKDSFSGNYLTLGWSISTSSKPVLVTTRLLYNGEEIDVFDVFMSEEELLFKEMQDISSHKQVSLARQLIADIGYDILQSIKRHCIKD